MALMRFGTKGAYTFLNNELWVPIFFVPNANYIKEYFAVFVPVSFR